MYLTFVNTDLVNWNNVVYTDIGQKVFRVRIVVSHILIASFNIHIFARLTGAHDYAPIEKKHLFRYDSINVSP